MKKEDKVIEEEVVETEDYSDADQFMYDYNSNDAKPDLSKSDSERKKLLMILAGVVGGGLLIIIVLFVFSLFSGGGYDYEEVEVIMQEAAESYFTDYPNDLPASETESSIIELDTLVETEYMDPVNSYIRGSGSCTGRVTVSMIGTEYYYKPLLDCGDAYSSLLLYEELIKTDAVETGYGLYSENGIHVYKGENINNYVQLDNNLWRIVSINSDNTTTLVLDDKYYYGDAWDDRYNPVLDNYYGMNDYSKSRIKENLEIAFMDNSENGSLLSDNDRSKTVPFDLCIGKRSPISDGKDNSIECQTVLENQNIGLLTASQFLNASSDSYCLSIDDKACQNYNYLVAKFDWWLLTASSDSEHETFKVDNYIEVENSSSYENYRPVITLNNAVAIKDGSGTLDDPYILR